MFSILISYNSYGEEINSLFGINLYDNAEKYISSSYIDSNKFKNDETIDNYYYLIITQKIKTKSPYFSEYLFVINNENQVHRIYGENEYDNLNICQAVQKDLLSSLEKKYQIKFKYKEKSYPTFKRYSNYYWTSSGNYFSMQCRKFYSDSSIKLQIHVTSPDLDKAVDEYYDSGL